MNKGQLRDLELALVKRTLLLVSIGAADSPSSSIKTTFHDMP